MQQKFENHIAQNFSFLIGKNLLLATSGGIDSMVMVDLFHKLSFEIAMAHCNFQLRGLESFEDQNFVQNYAQTNEIPLFLTQFDTKAFAKDYKLLPKWRLASCDTTGFTNYWRLKNTITFSRHTTPTTIWKPFSFIFPEERDWTV